MGRDEKESTPEERVRRMHDTLIPIPYTPRVLDLREHPRARERGEERPKELKLTNILALLAPILMLIIIILIIAYF